MRSRTEENRKYYLKTKESRKAKYHKSKDDLFNNFINLLNNNV
ncbi:MAG: hypothetical protein WC996_07735 [Peptostreptococcales bacterium]|jgi:hypothetical protein